MDGEDALEWGGCFAGIGGLGEGCGGDVEEPFVPEYFLSVFFVLDIDEELLCVPLQRDAIGTLRIAGVRVVAGAQHAAKTLRCAVPPREAGEERFAEGGGSIVQLLHEGESAGAGAPKLFSVTFAA